MNSPIFIGIYILEIILKSAVSTETAKCQREKRHERHCVESKCLVKINTRIDGYSSTQTD